MSQRARIVTVDKVVIEDLSIGRHQLAELRRHIEDKTSKRLYAASFDPAESNSARIERVSTKPLDGRGVAQRGPTLADGIAQRFSGALLGLELRNRIVRRLKG